MAPTKKPAAAKPPAKPPAKKRAPRRGASAKTPAKRRRTPTRRVGAVEKATLADLAEIRKADPPLADSALAATAVAMAKEIDGDNSATSKSMCAARLTDILADLRALAPPERKADGLDRIVAGRSARRDGGAGA